jgi:hypothetical protein
MYRTFRLTGPEQSARIKGVLKVRKAGDRGQVAEDAVCVNGQELTAGDGVAVSDERHLNIEGIEERRDLVFDLA